MNDRSDLNPKRQLPEKYAFTFASRQLQEAYDFRAPDGSKIRLLDRGGQGSLAHCTLPVGRVTQAVAHSTVEEVWYCLSGQGEIWRSFREQDAVTALSPGTSLTIPPGTHFQIRNTGNEPLCILMNTMPPWPGAEEAIVVPGFW